MAGCRLAIEQRAVGHRHDARGSVDREPSTGVIIQRVGDRVVGRIGIGCQSGHANHGAVGRILVDRVGCRVAVGDRTDVEFVDVVDVDR